MNLRFNNVLNFPKRMANGGSYLNYKTANGAKFYGAVILVTIVIVLVGSGAAGNFLANLAKLSSSGGGTGTGYVPGAVAAAQAYCQGIGLVSTANPPAGCSPQNVKLTLQLIDLGSGAAVPSNKYSCKVFVNTGSGYVFYESILTATSVTSCASVNTYTPGWQVVVEVCELTTACLVGGPGTATKTTYAYCQLPSMQPGLATQCGSGPGSGVVPFGGATGSPPLTVTLNLPFLALISSTDNGLNCAQPVGILNAWQNGTTIQQATPSCTSGTGNTTTKTFLCGNTGASACTAGNTAIPGSVGDNFLITTTINPAWGGIGTYPTAPWGGGCFTINPVDQSIQANAGTSARGLLQCALVIEVKNSGTTGMCIPGPWAGITPISSQASSGVFDVFYTYIVPDFSYINSANVITSTGITQGTMTWNCSSLAAGNSCASCMTLTYNFYDYFSQKYLAQNFAPNPETPQTGTTRLAATNTVTIGINS